MNSIKSDFDNNMYEPNAFNQFEKQKSDKQIFDGLKNIDIGPPKNIKKFPVDNFPLNQFPPKPHKSPIL
jgi:hypothetical protein